MAWPEPRVPVRNSRSPMHCRIGVAFSIAASSSPPIISARVPVIARGRAPDTGASIRTAPRSARIGPRVLVSPGSDELMSMTISPGWMASRKAPPSSSVSAWRTCLEVGSMVTTTSDAAISATLPAAWPPTSRAKRAVASASRSKTVRS